MKRSVNEWLQEIRHSLEVLSTPERKASTLRFFKHPVQVIGVSNPMTQGVGRKVIQEIKEESKEWSFQLAECLFETGYLEEALLACQIVYARKKSFESSDFKIFEKWVNIYIHNWAVCDTFCNQSVGHLLMTFPECVQEILPWSLHDNLWMRRACAVSFIYPAKRELYIEEQMNIALVLLEDKEDMVQKGYGWLLKVLSQKRMTLVFDFIEKYKERMPRTALRYAIEKMPKNFKEQAMSRSFPLSL
jgi:3-methyladenine DNA glycosylase AlkD